MVPHLTDPAEWIMLKGSRTRLWGKGEMPTGRERQGWGRGGVEVWHCQWGGGDVELTRRGLSGGGGNGKGRWGGGS